MKNADGKNLKLLLPNLEIPGGELGLVVSPDEEIWVYTNSVTVQTKIQPTTSEFRVDYVLESGALPSGVTLTSVNDTTAVISGVPTQVGSFSPVIKGTDDEGNTATVTLRYTVSAESDPITREQLITMIKNEEDVTQVNTSQITDMSSLLSLSRFCGTDHGFTSFNQDISRWDASNVTDMSEMFYNAIDFNQDISRWDVSNVTDMHYMFFLARGFNQDMSSWDVSNVTDMSSMFRYATDFNQDISSWNVSNVTNMWSMFEAARNFNQDIGRWDVGNVANMRFMFNEASTFNQDISSWDVSKVTDMWGMFERATSFTNQDLSLWNVSNVQDYSAFFFAAGPGNIEPHWSN